MWSRHAGTIETIRDYRQFDCRENYEPRFNFQMTDIQAALINSQLGRLAEIRSRRQEIVQAYLDALPDGLSVQAGIADVGRMPQRFVVVAPDLVTRDALRRSMLQSGISCTVPIERNELLHRYLKQDPKQYPVAERLVDMTISLPIHAGMSEAEKVHVASALHSFKP